MVLIPEVMKEGLCPYCYEGVLVLDPVTNMVHCNSGKCLKAVVLRKDKEQSRENARVIY